MTAHHFLREQTRAAHDRVDAHFAALDLADPADYARFLTAHAAAFIPAEQALDEAGADSLLPGWRDLRRSALLTADLTDLGLPLRLPIDPPIYGDDAQIFGGLYVLEGSRLGGAMLRRQVGAGLPRRFLDAVQPPGRWRDFTRALDRNLLTDAEQRRALDAAIATFMMFERTEWNAAS